jgi:DNA polymerase elongation subunit (family B)
MIFLVFASHKLQGRTMSYVDAFYDRDDDMIRVVERDDKGQRHFKDYPAKHIFYYYDPKGKFQSIYGDPLTRVSCKNVKELRKELAIHSNKKLYESDINPIYRCLEDHYLNVDAPKLNVAFWDIEVDFDPERGYASPDDAFMPITAIAVHLQWLDTLVCLAIPPKTMSMEEAKKSVEEFPNTMLFDNEADMLDTFLTLIEDADVLSGWNSEGFDIPYTVNRVAKVLSKDDTRRFCLWNQYPKKREFEKFGRNSVTYDLIGRVHLDSLEMYRKYTYEERHTYRLDAIGEMEVGETKTVYEGTLDQLYNNDFKKFIEYNRQDTALLDKLDKKLQFLDLANKIAHENTVLLQTTMGAVAVTEQAIINEAHRRGMIVPNRKKMEEQGDTQAAGAYVAYPKKGIHEWIGSLDINSLYPSAIRALNMGPETIVGQLRQDGTKDYIASEMGKGKSFASAWEGIFGSLEYTAVMDREVGREITIDWEDGGEDTLSAAQIHDLIFDSNQPWMLSANGTIFTYEKEGIIPGLLARWYSERKDMQKKLKESIAAGNKIEEEYWDKRQLVKKINLNSLYGAILNPGCRFFDNRIGQSTTLTGRQVAKHMASKVNEIVTGEYDHVGKAVIYGDTDSCYFSAYSVLKKDIEKGLIPWTKESVVELYDTIGETVNGTFVKFMQDAFHCPKTRGEVIKAGREIVASKGLFITKKRYAVLYYDKEGKRSDIDGKPGKIKAMGLDLKRSDTPVIIQDFLSEVLTKVLTGVPKEQVLEYITDFRTEFKTRPGWEKGSPKRANKITEYAAKEKKLGKANMPGHVRASLNWNTLKRMFDDKYSMNIVDGMKVIVCKIKDNPMAYTSVAYPVDELRLPQWFKDLPFDDAEMETTVIDEKLENLIGVLEWDISSTRSDNTFNKLFDFE